MDLTEKTLKSEEIYRGKIVTLLRDTVALPNGKTWNMDQCRVTGEMYGDISSERG